VMATKKATKAPTLRDEIAKAEIVADEGWEARIVCSHQAAKALRAATLKVDPFLGAFVTGAGVKLVARRTPNWPGLIERVKHAALA
jgi:hypothetical protein